ncbi:EamA family transporter [Chitinibacter sp. GC72]|uniref:EamA family transporter n=1 Tax=Chitinibacter sp. GC72 TaxID=1526917 RepID=UPI0012FCEB48|nr:EamA family transporter [Chitinibacter sp. GC72]
MRALLKPHLLLTALAPLIWGSSYIVTSQLLPPDRPFTAALIRVLPAGLILLALQWQPPAAGQWGKVLLLSLLNISLFQSLLFIAAYQLPGGLAAVIGAIQPLLILALIWMLEKIKPSLWLVCACLMGVLGMAALLLAPDSSWSISGVLAALAGAACMATGTYLTRHWALPLPVLALTGWQLLLGGVLLLPAMLWLDAPLPALRPSQLLAYAYLCIFGALIAYVLWFRGMRSLSAVAVSALGLLSPLSAVLLGWWLLGEAMSPLSLAGLLIVFASVMAVQWFARPVPSSFQEK